MRPIKYSARICAYLVISDVLDYIEQIGAGVLSVRVEFELSLSAVGAGAPQDSPTSLGSFLIKSRGSCLVHFLILFYYFQIGRLSLIHI